MLFGYDMRRVAHDWLSAWRDLLFSVGSPVRRRLDEPVLLCEGDRQWVYHGGALVADPSDLTEPTCRALLVPAELVLYRTLTVPLAAEADLSSVINIEAGASSPFPADDMVTGWAESDRGAGGIRVSLVIAARSSLAPWLEAQGTLGHDSELWADADGHMVTLRGFAEGRRDDAYRRRLLRCSMAAAGVLVLTLLAASLFAFQQSLALERSRDSLSAIAEQSEVATTARAELLAGNELISATNQVIAGFPNPHVELARLTRLLSDEAFVSHFSIRGRSIRIRGRALDAAGVMKTLAEERAYSTVTAPQAITAVGNSGEQQFYLDISVAVGDDGDREDGS